MTRLSLVLVITLLTGCPPANLNEASQLATRKAPLADELRFAGCAPLRYRAMTPAGLAARPHRPRAPTPPTPFSVVTARLPNATHRLVANQVTRELNAAKKEIIECLGDELGDNRRHDIQLTLSVFRRGFRLTNIRGPSSRSADRCLRATITRRLSSRISASQSTFLHFTIRVGPRSSRPGHPKRRRGLLEVLTTSDRVEETRALSTVVAQARPQLKECLAKHEQRGSGTALATLTLVARKVESANIETSGSVDGLSECWAAVLAGRDPGGVAEGGFQCALSYGPKAKTPLALELDLGADGLQSSEGEITPVQINAPPPQNELYKKLLALRFRDPQPSPAPASLVLDPEASGQDIVVLIENARAADIDVVSLRVRGTGTDAPASTSATPTPQLGQVAARPAVVTVIVTKRRVWVGAVAGDGVEMELTPNEPISRAITELANRPGLAGRQDVTLGLSDDAVAGGLAPIIEALKAAGFDRLRVVGAENARARLAR